MIKILHGDAVHEYANISLHTSENIYFENGGFFPNTKATLRIMTADEVCVSKGDTLMTDFGDFTIVGVRDNRRCTSIPHWKITARG